ncbi:response regulator transcription factor [Propioniciclava soli]|uniref:response regulator n=1 Tax=Propioniciclava soli TaxID=2775081 RepID=UPI001E548480|nr:response regulator transcription factor [Propioniciclava soli]
MKHHQPIRAAIVDDGDRAATWVDEHEVDVSLMDIRVPRLDGVEATRRIVGRGEPPRVLVVTTFNVDKIVLGVLGAGARGFLLKDANSYRVSPSPSR